MSNPATQVTQVWYVHDADPDVWPLFFTDKESAEMYARMCFPDEEPDKRYARVHYREVHRLTSHTTDHNHDTQQT